MTESNQNNGGATLTFGDGILVGILLGMVITALVAFISNGISYNDTKAESLELIERTEGIEAMMSEKMSRTVRFATNEGYVIYYDGKLYVERDTHD